MNQTAIVRSALKEIILRAECGEEVVVQLVPEAAKASNCLVVRIPIAKPVTVDYQTLAVRGEK